MLPALPMSLSVEAPRNLYLNSYGKPANPYLIFSNLCFSPRDTSRNYDW